MSLLSGSIIIDSMLLRTFALCEIANQKQFWVNYYVVFLVVYFSRISKGSDVTLISLNSLVNSDLLILLINR